MHFNERTNIFGVDRKSLLFKIRGSGQGSRYVRLNGRNGAPHLALLDQGSGCLLVEGGDSVSDDGDVALHGGLVSLQGDGLGLELLVAAGAGFVLGLCSRKFFACLVLGLGEGGLGVGSLVVDGGGEGGKRRSSTLGGLLGGLDLLGLGSGIFSEEFHLGLDGSDLGTAIIVDSLCSLTLGG